MGKNILFLLIVLVFVSGCAQQQQNPSLTENQAVIIKNFAFSPSTLTVKAGTAVSWINMDSAAHSIKSDGFTSPNLNKGDSFEFKFNSKGTYSYICGLHPSMKGKIVVEG